MRLSIARALVMREVVNSLAAGQVILKDTPARVARTIGTVLHRDGCTEAYCARLQQSSRPKA